MSHTPGSSASPGLPNDVMVYIVSNLDRNTLAQIRLCCKWLAKEAARHLFAEVSFHMHAESMERVIAIANSMFAGAVKTLKLLETPRLVKFSKKEWYKQMGLDSDRGRTEGDIRIKKDKERIDQLFQEYEAQRTEEPTLYECLHAPGPGVSGSILTESDWPKLKTRTAQVWRLQRACTDFDKALLKLHNLKEVEACFTRSEGTSTLRWRDYEFLDISYDEFFGLDVDDAAMEEAAPLAILLRAMGQRDLYSSSLNSLTSLRLDFSMSDWWGPQDSIVIWEAQWRGMEEEKQAILKRNLTVAVSAFDNLTDVHVRFNDRDDMPEFLRALALYLSRADELRRLELRLETRYKTWPPLDMLAKINERGRWPRWPMLRHLSLKGFVFPKSSILRTLSFAAPTLESFSLQNCMMLGGDNPWSRLFEDMSLIPFQNLHRPEFRFCEQDTPNREILNTAPRPWSFQELDARSIVLIHMKNEGEHYAMGYSSLIYDYILKRTDIMPPLELFSTSATDSGSLSAEKNPPQIVSGGRRWFI